jgi:AraC family transcriptional regulator, transcriptional activator of pobA
MSMALMQVSRRQVPTFTLYGESREPPAATEALHIEDIPSRSRKYLWRIGAHRHRNLCQCVFVTAGGASFALDGERGDLGGPCAILVPAGTIHGFRFRAETQGYVLTVDLHRLLGLAAPSHQAAIHSLFERPRALDLASDPLFAGRAAQLFERLLVEFRQPENLAPVASWLGCCVLWLFAHKAAAPAPPDALLGRDLDRLRRLRLSIEAHLTQHWPVARYARELSLSGNRLNRLCMRVTGSTAFDLIQQRLSLEARRRLVYVAGSVTTIAAELGFKDAAYFCRFFRRHNGMSPVEYRRRHGGA